jgi:hypothetical protein
VSVALSSYMIAQLSENPDLQAVFDDLFDAEGSAIGLKPASWYVPTMQEVRFTDRRRRRRRKSRSGTAGRWLRRARRDHQPPKSEMLARRDDRVVVIGPPE